MDKSIVVRFFQRFSHFTRDPQCFRQRQTPGTQSLVKRLSSNKLHNEEQLVALLADLKDLADEGMV